MKNYDRSLIEVWEWKERVYNDTKDLTPTEYLNKLRNDAEKILSQRHITLNSVFLKEKHLKVT